MDTIKRKVLTIAAWMAIATTVAAEGKIPEPVVDSALAYKAESYHQDFAIKHPNDSYIVINDLPKVTRLRQQFPALYVH